MSSAQVSCHKDYMRKDMRQCFAKPSATERALAQECGALVSSCASGVS